MARVCAITGRKARSGNSRSHAMNATKRKWGANLQKKFASSLTVK
ncbi:hypothetical protein GCM10020331_047390 [Ectobacillus funiculus]